MTIETEFTKIVPRTDTEDNNVIVLSKLQINDNVAVRGLTGYGSQTKLGHIVAFVYDDNGAVFIRIELIDHFTKKPTSVLTNPSSPGIIVTKIVPTNYACEKWLRKPFIPDLR